MSHARFENGRMVQLDRKAEPRQAVTVADVQDPERLARLLNELRDGVDAERSRFKPRKIDFVDIPVDNSGDSTVRLAHHFGGRVWWYVIAWKGASFSPFLVGPSTLSTDNVLVLGSLVTGTATIRVEEAG